MAVINVDATDDFEFYEASFDLNGGSTDKTGVDTFNLSESYNVHPVGDFPFYPPFFVTPRPTIYSASFGGDEGYEEPTTVMRLVAGSEYPQINLTLYGTDDQPFDSSPLTYDDVNFCVALSNGSFVELALTEVDETIGRWFFSWPSNLPIGTHLGRAVFLVDDDPDPQIALLSIPTHPLTVEVREL